MLSLISSTYGSNQVFPIPIFTINRIQDVTDNYAKVVKDFEISDSVSNVNSQTLFTTQINM